MSADSLVPAAGNPQMLNRYAYSLSNPIKYIDPSGHAVACFSDAGTGCEGFGPSTILSNYWLDSVAQENALADFIATHPNYNPYSDPLLDETAQVMVLNTSFRVRADNASEYGAQIGGYAVAAAAAAMVLQGESGRQFALPLFQGNTPLTNSAHVPGSGNAYSVAYEVELPRSVWSQHLRSLDRRVANRMLARAIDSDPAFAAGMDTLIPGVRNELTVSPQ